MYTVQNSRTENKHRVPVNQPHTDRKKQHPTNVQQLTAAGATQDLTVSDMEPFHTLGQLIPSSKFFLHTYILI